MKDSRSVFIVFPTQKDRQDIHSKLTFLLSSRPGNDPTISPGAMLRTPLLSRVSARVFTGGRDEISTAQRKWQAREISNVGRTLRLSRILSSLSTSSPTSAFSTKHLDEPVAM